MAGRAPAPRSPDFPADVLPYSKKTVTQDSTSPLRLPQQKAAACHLCHLSYVPVSPSHASLPTLLCFLLLFISVSWPVVLFPRKIWPFKDSQRLLSSSGSSANTSQVQSLGPQSLFRSRWALLGGRGASPSPRKVSLDHSGTRLFLCAPRFNRQIPREPGCRRKAKYQLSIKSQIPNFQPNT